MTRKITALLITLACIFAFAACQSTPDVETNYTAKEVMDKVKASMTDLPEFKEADMSNDEWKDILFYVTDVATDKVKDIDYLYMTNNTADELCVMVMADEDSAKEVVEDMDHRIEVQKNYFESYNTEELSKLDGACAVRSGKVCIMLIGNQAQNGKYEFDKMMKGN